MIDLRKAGAIAGASLRRLTREWSALFFLFVFPIVLVMVIGLTFGGDASSAIGVVAPDGDPLAADVVHALERNDGLDVHRYGSEASLRRAVEQGHVDGGVVIPAGYGDSVRAARSVDVGYLMGPTGAGALVRPAVDDAVREQSARLQAARFATEHGGGDFDAALDQVTELARTMPRLTVHTEKVGDSMHDEFEGLGQFDLGASSELVLFVFVSGIAGSAAIINTRKLGIARRMLSTPTSAGTVLMGEALASLATSLIQAVYILVATWALFDVNWGNLTAAVPLIVMFCLVTTGVAMLAGSVFSNDQQASSVGVFLGMGLGALGGCMLPLAMFTGVMRTVAHLTPHAWTIDAFSQLVQHDGGLGDILPNLAVLAGMAAALLTIASWRLRKALTTA
jgi:ABC-2 type transport system permease protein